MLGYIKAIALGGFAHGQQHAEGAIGLGLQKISHQLGLGVFGVRPHGFVDGEGEHAHGAPGGCPAGAAVAPAQTGAAQWPAAGKNWPTYAHSQGPAARVPGGCGRRAGRARAPPARGRWAPQASPLASRCGRTGPWPGPAASSASRLTQKDKRRVMDKSVGCWLLVKLPTISGNKWQPLLVGKLSQRCAEGNAEGNGPVCSVNVSVHPRKAAAQQKGPSGKAGERWRFQK